MNGLKWIIVLLLWAGCGDLLGQQMTIQSYGKIRTERPRSVCEVLDNIAPSNGKLICQDQTSQSGEEKSCDKLKEDKQVPMSEINGNGEKKKDADSKIDECENQKDKDSKSKRNVFWSVAAAIAAAALCFILYKRKKIQPTPHSPSPEPEPASVSTPESEPNSKPTSEFAPLSDLKREEWVVVGASVKGNGHIESDMPCQDNNKFITLGKGWGVAVVSDGAGSAAHSDMGSKVVVERGVVHFKNLIEKEGWMDQNTLPSDAEWMHKSYVVLKTIRDEVEIVAKKNNVDLKSLSATILAVVFSPLGLLAVHVGDGRMGCKTASAGWKAIMTPHKGDEANQTLFLISNFWDIPLYVQSGVLVPESVVVREPVKAFVLMSDGCENTSWLCSALNAETGKYYDQNKPFEGFFNPLEETLLLFQKEQVSEQERQEKWFRFIESGTKGFVREQDDKSMILGVFCGE